MFRNKRSSPVRMTTNVRLVSVDEILTFLYMTLNDYKDLECEANRMTTPQEKVILRTKVEQISITERMADFWKDYEAWQNPWVIRPSTYTPRTHSKFDCG